MRYLILVIRATIKRCKIFSILFTGPSTPWMFVILSRGAQCAKKRKPSIEYLLDCSNL